MLESHIKFSLIIGSIGWSTRCEGTDINGDLVIGFLSINCITIIK